MGDSKINGVGEQLMPIPCIGHPIFVTPEGLEEWKESESYFRLKNLPDIFNYGFFAFHVIFPKYQYTWVESNGKITSEGTPL